MWNLTVHPERRYLMKTDGAPFFYLADTAWELFHRLTQQEVNRYFAVRAQQGFNVVLAVALPEFDGLSAPNAYGRCPLRKTDGRFDPARPDIGGEYDYWQHVDYVINRAAEYGLYIALVPTWGDKYNLKWGKGPEIFDPQNAAAYGGWIARRYRDFPNIIWVLGGDRPLENETHYAVMDAMGGAIRAADTQHLITYHPSGDSSSADYVLNRDYIDFHGTQTGHGTSAYDCWKLLRRTCAAEDKPFLDLEPRYEDHPACFQSKYGYLWDAADVRQNAYWAMMEGVCGHTYGNHCVWSMNTTVTDYFPYLWQDALSHEGAEQMQFAKRLRLSRPYFEFRPAPELIQNDSAIMARQCAGRGERYAYVYTPLGQPVRAYLDKLCKEPVRATWFDPRTGSFTVFAVVAPQEALFVPPSSGKGQDWVLVLDVMEA